VDNVCNYFVANSFEIMSATFYQNRREFYRRHDKNMLAYFFWDTVYINVSPVKV